MSTSYHTFNFTENNFNANVTVTMSVIKGEIKFIVMYHGDVYITNNLVNVSEYAQLTPEQVREIQKVMKVISQK